MRIELRGIHCVVFAALLATFAAAAETDPLPAWSDGQSKSAIINALQAAIYRVGLSTDA